MDGAMETWVGPDMLITHSGCRVSILGHRTGGAVLIRAAFDPGSEAECVNANAKHISGDETELSGMEADNTDNKAVNP
jgi:hypothetical protein